MRRNDSVNCVKTIQKATTLLATLMLSASSGLYAATPEPLPPPPELLDGGYGQSVNLQYGAGQGGYIPADPYANVPYGQIQQGQPQYNQPQPGPPPYPLGQQGLPPYGQLPQGQIPGQAPGNAGGDVYDPYNTSVSNYLPPLPGRPAAEVGAPYVVPSPWQGGPVTPPDSAYSVPNLNAPPMANLPPEARASSGPTVISPPARNMPDDYFDLPLPVMETGAIPGVLMPELNEEFYDPGMGAVSKRPIRIGMSSRQLEPFFDLAKGHEKNALAAKKINNGPLYRDELKRAIDAYMEIIAMADSGHDAREEAWYGVARCEYRRENWWKSFDALERSFPSKFNKQEVEGRIKLEMFIGERLWRMGHSPVVDARNEDQPLTGFQAASKVYAAAVFNQPNAKEAPLALLRRGDAAAMDGDWKEASKLYRTVVQYYPDSEPAMQARSSLAEAVYRQEWPSGFPEAARNDLASFMTEVEAPEQTLSGPAEERRQRAVALANSHEADMKLRQAKDYMQKIRVKKSRDAAVFQLGEIVSHYPNTPQANEAANLLLGMGIEPPMVLSSGNRYPVPSGGATMLDRVANTMAAGGNGGGSIDLRRQPDIRGDMYSPVSGPQSQSDRRFGMERGQFQPYSEPSFGSQQGAFSPTPGVPQSQPQGAWPSPRIELPQRPGYGQPPQSAPRTGMGQQPGQAGMGPSRGSYGAYGLHDWQGTSPVPQSWSQGQGGYGTQGGYGQGQNIMNMPGYGNMPGQGYAEPFRGGQPQRRLNMIPQRVEPRPEDVYVPGVTRDF